MKVKGLLKFYLPAVAVAMGMGSCQDFNADFSEEALKKEQFAEQFAKDFGKIDPNQDWSMAGRFTANVNLDSKVEGVLSIYTKEPGLDGSYLLAKAEVKEGRANVEFDAIKGTDLLYAVIQKNGRNIVASNYDVVNNTITLGHLATRALTKTAAEDDVTTTEYTISETNPETHVVSYPLPWRMTKETVAALVASGKDSYESLGDYNYWTGTNANQLNAIAYEKLYSLSNNHEEVGAEYTLEQLWKIFGKKKSGGSSEFEIEGVFQEGEDHIERYVKPGILHRDASLVVAEDGPVSMELIWRGTDYYDLFGYFFYPSDGSAITAEYLWSTPKYILFGDDPARPVGGSSNLTQVSHWNDALNGGAGGYNPWENLTGMLAQNVFSSEKTKMRGTKMWLVNFKDGQPTYEFEKGTKLGFFLYSPRIHQIVFSDTKLNYQLNYSPYKKGETGEEDNDQSRPYAVTFNYKGSTLLGFADGCNDYDINDVVFGAFNVEEVPDITPDEPEPEAITWMVACEDLGGTFDYDFNDLVFGIRKTPNLDISKSTLSLIPYAAGGTLEAHVLYNGQDKGEIHKMFGESNSYKNPINVTAGSTPSPGSPVTLDNSVNSETDINTLASNITVKVQSDAASNIFISRGDQYNGIKAPQMILFQAGWDWPSEGVDIRDAYPDFKDWVAEESAHTDWYMNFDESYGHVNSPLAKPNTGGDSGNGGGGNGDEESPLPEANFTVSISSVTLDINETATFAVEGDGNNSEYELISSNESIASVTTTGVRYGTNTITANSAGDATITVAYKKDATHKRTEKFILVHVNEPAPDITAGTYNLTIPSATTYNPSWGGSYQDYKLSVGNYSCPSGLTGTITVNVKECPSNEVEIFTKDNSGLGRMQLYNGDTSVSKSLTNEQLKKLLAGQFSIINYASSDIEITSVTLVVTAE